MSGYIDRPPGNGRGFNLKLQGRMLKLWSALDNPKITPNVSSSRIHIERLRQTTAAVLWGVSRYTSTVELFLYSPFSWDCYYFPFLLLMKAHLPPSDPHAVQDVNPEILAPSTADVKAHDEKGFLEPG